jgi:Flp pilus assembly protein TadG
MSMTGLSRITADRRGATLVEFSVVFGTFMALIMGVVEFSFAFWQWNSASKAIQIGLRLASVSDPVDSTLVSFTGVGSDNPPGGASLPYDRVCNGATATCTSGTYNAAAMNRLVFGRTGNACQDGAGNFPGMCDIFPRITAQNVRVRYEYTGMGFAGRPGGPVPTVTIELQNLFFDFVFLDVLVPGMAGTILMPGLRSTRSGEDLSFIPPA